jgi:xanthine dehydrogenase accessory factor
MNADLLELAAELRSRGETFALATVVRCERPTSAKPGARALIRPDGTVTGWVGGACAEPIVVREALAALSDGRPRLVGLIGEGRTRPGRTEGLVEYPMACHSGGTLEIYVEPHLARPLLVLVGHGPVVETLAILGRAAEYAVEVTGAEADHAVEVTGGDVERAVHVVGGGALRGALDRLRPSRRSAVVIATHGESDEEALEQVLRTEAGYVSLVASRRRADAILDRLRGRGVSGEHLARLKAPAGLDIGAETPQEIAVSILAEIIQHHRGDKGASPRAEANPERAVSIETTDPICGMRVDPATARHRSEAWGRAVYFCCRGCQEAFDADPQRYRAAVGT